MGVGYMVLLRKTPLVIAYTCFKGFTDGATAEYMLMKLHFFGHSIAISGTQRRDHVPFDGSLGKGRLPGKFQKAMGDL